MRFQRLVARFFVAALWFAAPALAQQKPVDPAKAFDGFDDFVNQTIKDWHGAGAAVAIVQGDKVILLKGYGYRDVDKKLPMTPKSLCAIASITKSFTVTDLGMLMDEGKGGWDLPVRSVFPAFKLYDPILTEQMTVRDLVTHRSGLPRHDMVWYSSDFSRDDLIRRLQYLEPNKPLRSTFQYNNLMFMTAGYVAGLLDNKKWEDSLRARVLAPLGMNTTTFSLKELQASSDFALPYQKGHDLKAELKRMPFEATCPDTCALGPAGELNSNAEDMSHYLLFHLNKGAYNGRQLLSENNSSQMQTPQMTISGTPDYPELGENSYGMGSSSQPIAATSESNTVAILMASVPSSRFFPMKKLASSSSRISMAPRCPMSSRSTPSIAFSVPTKSPGASAISIRKPPAANPKPTPNPKATTFVRKTLASPTTSRNMSVITNIPAMESSRLRKSLPACSLN